MPTRKPLQYNALGSSHATHTAVGTAGEVRGAMSAKTELRCRCGHRVSARDVLCQGYRIAQGRPVSVYFKYRCSRCGRLAERRVPVKGWDESALHAPTGELSAGERHRFARLGSISSREVAAFGSLLRAAGPMALQFLRR